VLTVSSSGGWEARCPQSSTASSIGTSKAATLRSEREIGLALKFRLGRILEVALAQMPGDLGHALAAPTEIVRQLDLESCLEFHPDIDEVEAVETKVLNKTGSR